MHDRWRHLKFERIHQLTVTAPPERRWAWDRHDQHGLILRDPQGRTFRFKYAGGIQIKPFTDEP